MRMVICIINGTESPDNVFHIVTIHILYLPTKCRPTVTDIINPHHIFGISTNLQMITIYYSYQIIQLVLPGSHCSLVYGTFTLLTVSHQHIGFIIPLIHFSCHGYTHPDRQAMSQGSSIHFNTRNSDSGVPRKNGTILPQGVQNAFSHEPSGFQRHIQSLHTMSLTQNETIPQIILRVTCIYIHHIKVKSSKNIEARQVSTDMSGFCFIDNFN